MNAGPAPGGNAGISDSVQEVCPTNVLPLQKTASLKNGGYLKAFCWAHISPDPCAAQLYTYRGKSVGFSQRILSTHLYHGRFVLLPLFTCDCTPPYTLEAGHQYSCACIHAESFYASFERQIASFFFISQNVDEF